MSSDRALLRLLSTKPPRSFNVTSPTDHTETFGAAVLASESICAQKSGILHHFPCPGGPDGRKSSEKCELICFRHGSSRRRRSISSTIHLKAPVIGLLLWNCPPTSILLPLPHRLGSFSHGVSFCQRFAWWETPSTKRFN